MPTDKLSATAACTEPPLPAWVKLSTLYLYLPLILFAAGWFKLWIALPLLTCVAGSLGWMFFRPSECHPFRPRFSVTAGFSTRIALIAAFFAVLSGLCHWVPQSADYLKHNLILGDLIQRPWPVRYQVEGGGRFLCYGLGYYILPATFAKLFGISKVGIAVFAWAALGLFLFFIWLGRRFTHNPSLGIIVFLLTAGLGAFWHTVKSGFIQSLLFPDSAGPETAEMLLDLGLYTSNLDSFTRIFYQPQHGIVGWLGAALIYELVIVRRRWTEAAFVWAATLFWSPVTAIGLAVIAVAAFITSPRNFRFHPAFHLASAFAVTLVLAAFFLPHFPIAEKGFIWTLAEEKSWMTWYILFVLFFVLIPASSIAWLEHKRPYLGPLRPVVVAMTLLLLLTPLFKFGQMSDFRMQISGPAFLFIAVAMAKGILEPPIPRISAPYLYLCLVFLAGTAFPLIRSVENLIAGSRTDYRIETLRKQHLNSILDLRMPGFDVTSQYLGDGNSRPAGLILKVRPTP